MRIALVFTDGGENFFRPWYRKELYSPQSLGLLILTSNFKHNFIECYAINQWYCQLESLDHVGAVLSLGKLTWILEEVIGRL